MKYLSAYKLQKKVLSKLTSNPLHTAPCYLKMVQVMQVNANVSD